MMKLDCDTSVAATRSLAHIFGTEEQVLHDFAVSLELRQPEPHRIGEIAYVEPGWEADQAFAIAQETFGPAHRPETTCWFHATRSYNPGLYLEEGLLPLQAILDDIWDWIEGLAQGVVPADLVKRARLGFDRHPMQVARRGTESQQGPFGWLIGDVARNPRCAGKREYGRKAPEAVEDMIEMLDGREGPLMEKYIAHTKRCIVKFNAQRDPVGSDCSFEDDLGHALFYLHQQLSEDEPYLNECTDFISLSGTHVPPEQIEGVEVLPED